MKVAIVLAFFGVIATAYSHNICGRFGKQVATFPHRNDCSSYYQCSRGNLVARHCQDGLLYNSKYARCVIPQKSGCPNYQKYVDERNKEYCQIFGESSLFANVLECSQFYECANGVPVKFDCSQGLVFNSRTNRCDYPDQTSCVNWLRLPFRPNFVKADEIIEAEQVDDLVEEQVAFPDEFGVETQE